MDRKGRRAPTDKEEPDKPHTFTYADAFKCFPPLQEIPFLKRMSHPAFIKSHRNIFSKQSQNQLPDKALLIPSHLFFLLTDFYLLTMVTIFKTDETLATREGSSHPVLPFLS